MTWSQELLCRLRGVLSAKAEQLTSSSSGKIRILPRYLVLLAHYSLQIAVAISHQLSHSFAILAMFFSLCKPRGLLFHFLQLYQNSRANTTLSPELFHYIGFFWWYPALLTSFYWISQTSLKLIDQWLAEYEELARKFVPSELEKYFE